MTNYEVGSSVLSIAFLQEIIQSGRSIALSTAATDRITKCRAYLDEKLSRTEDPIYGINTGVGYLQTGKVAAV